jgi:hypothetical protein
LTDVENLMKILLLRDVQDLSDAHVLAPWNAEWILPHLPPLRVVEEIQLQSYYLSQLSILFSNCIRRAHLIVC